MSQQAFGVDAGKDLAAPDEKGGLDHPPLAGHPARLDGQFNQWGGGGSNRG